MTLRVQLLKALRRLPRGAGSSALQALWPLMDAVLEASSRAMEEESLEHDYAQELTSLLGQELGEETPATLEETVLWLANQRDGNGAHRIALIPFHIELLKATRELQASRKHTLISAEVLEAIQRAQRVLREAQERAQIPELSRLAPFREEYSWDPLTAFSELHSQLAACVKRLVDELNRIHQPLVVDFDEAVELASSILGGRAPSRRPGLLILARSLDGFLRRAPLTPDELEVLRKMSRAADQEREEDGWEKVADRLWILRARLVGSKTRPVPPLYRKHSQNIERRPNSMERMIHR